MCQAHSAILYGHPHRAALCAGAKKSRRRSHTSGDFLTFQCFQPQLQDSRHVRSVFLHQLYHNSLLRMQAVLCLIEDLVGMFLEDFLGDLLSAVCRETVLDHSACVCGCEELSVDLVVLEDFLSLLFLPLSAFRP